MFAQRGCPKRLHKGKQNHTNINLYHERVRYSLPNLANSWSEPRVDGQVASLANWLRDCLAAQMADWLAAWLAGSLAVWEPGWLPRILASSLPRWLAGICQWPVALFALYAFLDFVVLRAFATFRRKNLIQFTVVFFVTELCFHFKLLSLTLALPLTFCDEP